MTQIHPIYQKELDTFREYIKSGDPYITISEVQQEWIESFLLASLQRASMAVVEESMGEEKKHDDNYNCGDYNDECEIKGANANRIHTLATAREITGVNETK